jgi:hypothetical protein
MVADGARFTTRFVGLLAILARHGIVDKGRYRREGISWLLKTSFVAPRERRLSWPLLLSMSGR